MYLLTKDSQSVPCLTCLATMSLFSMFVSLFLFHGYVHLYHILDSTYKWYHMAFVFLFLTYLVWSLLAPSMLLQMALFHSFLWLNCIPLYTHTHTHTSIYLSMAELYSIIHTHTHTHTHISLSIYHFFFIHSPVSEHLGFNLLGVFQGQI